MGRGAIRLAADVELRSWVEAEGWTITDDEIEAVDEGDPEIARTTELIRRLAKQVGHATNAGAADLGVVWFDAHADFDDPEENESGFFDVMGLVVLAGVRDLEEYQRRRVAESDLATIPGEIDPERFAIAVGELATRVSRVYLHVYLDSIDLHEARANRYAAPGGPTLDRLLDCIRLTGERLGIVAAAITAYDPAYDADDRALRGRPSGGPADRSHNGHQPTSPTG